MKVLILSGPTIEEIDSVRSIINLSTGRTGKTIADRLSKNNNITFVSDVTSIRPANLNIRFIDVRGVLETFETVQRLLSTEEFDWVIQPMAVSDYYVESIKSPNNELHEINPKIKLSSSTNEFDLKMKRAPKIIAHIKKWQPRTKLISFKLGTGLSLDEIKQLGIKSVNDNQSEFCIVNDTEHIGNDHHAAWLVNESNIIPLKDNQEIADKITELVMGDRND